MRLLFLVNRGLMATSLNIHGGVWAQTPFLDSLAAESLVGRFHFSETPDNEEVRRIWESGFKAWPKPNVQRFYIGEHWEPSTLWPGDQPTHLKPGLWQKPLKKAIQSAEPTQPALIIVETDFLLPPWEEEALCLPDPGEALGGEDDGADLEGVYVEEEEAEDEDDAEEDGHDPDGPEIDGNSNEDDPNQDDKEDSEEPEETSPRETPVAMIHGPIDPEGPEYRRLQAGRGLLLAAWDEEIQSLYEMVDKAWADGPWAMVITSDTGYPLGEAGHIGPDKKRPIHQERLRIPLVIHAPGMEPGSAIREFTDHKGLAEWLSRACTWDKKQPPIPAFDGKLTHIASEGPDPDDWAAIRTLDATLIAKTAHDEPSFEDLRWYEQPEDFFEINDLAQSEQERVYERYKTLREILSPEASPDDAPP